MLFTRRICPGDRRRPLPAARARVAVGAACNVRFGTSERRAALSV